MKNLNSFKAISRAIEGERQRQIELLEGGKKVIQETRRWDDNKEASHAMRSKEDARDYRYFSDPDPPTHIYRGGLAGGCPPEAARIPGRKNDPLQAGI